MSCFAYCDDLGLAVSNISVTWIILKRCFVIIARVASLSLNVDKNQFHFTSPDNHAEDAARFLERHPEISSKQVSDVVKYLGVFLGRNANDLNWQQPLAKFADTAAFISTLDCGFATGIALYNMLAISKLSFI